MSKRTPKADEMQTINTSVINSTGNGEKSDYYSHEIEEGNYFDEESSTVNVGCSTKQLPERLFLKAAEVAAGVNPVNAPLFGTGAIFMGDSEPIKSRAAVVLSKYWGPSPRKLTVSFMDNPSVELRKRILSHLNAWTRTGCIEFVETQGIGKVRISRGPGGYWSYLGTDVLLIPQNRPTLNLQGFTMNTPNSEYIRVVRHEAGHTLGMPHEHMRKELVQRIDPQKAYEYFWRTQGWDKPTVNQQVLTPLNQSSIMGTPADQDSIMCYQLPGSITYDGNPIRGGRDINQSDYTFVGKIYPKPAADVLHTEHQADDWSESEDPEIDESDF